METGNESCARAVSAPVVAMTNPNNTAKARTTLVNRIVLPLSGKIGLL
jgi:hypothetical protein